MHASHDTSLPMNPHCGSCGPCVLPLTSPSNFQVTAPTPIFTKTTSPTHDLESTQTCRMPLVVKSKAAAVPPVLSHQLMVRCLQVGGSRLGSGAGRDGEKGGAARGGGAKAAVGKRAYSGSKNIKPTISIHRTYLTGESCPMREDKDSSNLLTKYDEYSPRYRKTAEGVVSTRFYTSVQRKEKSHAEKQLRKHTGKGKKPCHHNKATDLCASWL